MALSLSKRLLCQNPSLSSPFRLGCTGSNYTAIRPSLPTRGAAHFHSNTQLSRGNLLSSARLSPSASLSHIGFLRSFSSSRTNLSRTGDILLLRAPRRWLDKRPLLKGGVFTIFSLGFSFVLVIGTILLYDATTYSHKHIDRVPVNPLALNPERGGPKNLKVARVLLDDEESEDQKALERKPRLVIVGGGWGAVSVLKTVKPGEYHVLLVSPDNYNLFTPLLPSATVGTVEVRSLVEPLRKLIARVRGHFLQASVVDIDMSERLLEIKPSGGGENFYVPYDKCVLAVGAVSNDHGVPGLENCFQLKTVPDVMRIRQRIIENLETAALPATSDEDRKKLLSFVVCGGGPTGVEFASELYDMVNEDVLNYFPKLLRKEISIHLIQSRDHILNTYSEKISEYAEKRFSRTGIDTVLNARVKGVTPESVTYTVKQPDGSVQEFTIPSGFTLWSTGIAMNPLTKKIATKLPNQYHKHALEVDAHLRIKGAPLSTLYAIGDCATVETNLVDHLLELVDQCDKNKDGKIDYQEFELMVGKVRRMFPTSQVHIEKVREVFEQYDKDKDNVIGLNELAEMFSYISARLTSLPATAQVASQQGKYLGKKFNKIARAHDTLVSNDIPDDIGNSAVFDFGKFDFAGGLIAMYLWRSIYWSEQVSTRTRLLLILDWIKRGIFGRDISKF